jgi:hypothetical protein
MYLGSGGITCVVVAFITDGTSVEIFQGILFHLSLLSILSRIKTCIGELEGKVVLPRGEQGLGWEYPYVYILSTFFHLFISRPS